MTCLSVLKINHLPSVCSGSQFHLSKVRYSRHYDLLTAVGFLVALQATRRLVRSGTLWCGAPCSSWVWMSRGTTYRCPLRPKGKKKLTSVRAMNKLVRRLCFVSLGCIHRLKLLDVVTFSYEHGSVRPCCHTVFRNYTVRGWSTQSAKVCTGWSSNRGVPFYLITGRSRPDLLWMFLSKLNWRKKISFPKRPTCLKGLVPKLVKHHFPQPICRSWSSGTRPSSISFLLVCLAETLRALVCSPGVGSPWRPLEVIRNEF